MLLLATKGVVPPAVLSLRGFFEYHPEMLKNFSLRSSIEIAFEGQVLDIHNDFCLTSLQIEYVKQSGSITLQARCKDSESARSYLIEFHKITKLISDVQFVDGDSLELDELGYLNDMSQSSFEEGYVLDEKSFCADSGMKFHFFCGSSLALKCEKVMLRRM